MADLDNKIKFEIGKNKDSEIVDAIMSIITNYYPVSDNRIHSLLGRFGNSNSRMVIDTTFVKVDGKDETGISFNWSKSARQLPDFLEIDGLLTDSLLFDLFTTILKDHEVISSFTIDNSIIRIETNINFREESKTGIDCFTIEFDFDFYYHPDKEILMDKMVKFFTLNFFEPLQRTSFMKEALNSYFTEVKQCFINNLSSDDLRNFISMLDDDVLIKIIEDLPNNVFTPNYTKFNEDRNPIKLTKELRENNNDNN